MARHRKQPARQVLRADGVGTQHAEAGDEGLAAAVGGDRPHSWFLARRVVMKRRSEQDLDEELQSYLEIAVEEQMRRGLSREEATRAARVEFGSVEAVKDNVRDVGWEAGVERLWRDVRYAAR